MRKSDIIGFFGSQTAAAAAIGVTKSAVCQWKEDRPIPLKCAIAAQAASKGALRVDLSLYEGTTQKALVDFGRSAARSRRHVNA